MRNYRRFQRKRPRSVGKTSESQGEDVAIENNRQRRVQRSRKIYSRRKIINNEEKPTEYEDSVCIVTFCIWSVELTFRNALYIISNDLSLIFNNTRKLRKILKTIKYFSHSKDNRPAFLHLKLTNFNILSIFYKNFDFCYYIYNKNR